MSEKDNVKFSACAMIDLLGFSSHLELSAYDLRTNIGKQAINRLENLERAISNTLSEKEKYPEYYPDNLNIQRINDALFITIDLNDILIPSIGVNAFTGLSIEKISAHFTKEQLDNETDYKEAYEGLLYDSISPLQSFIGIIARLHIFLNKLEAGEHFPGAKTVISTGFRRPFLSGSEKKEDMFSANFALANVYTAEKELHGPNFYVDNFILQILSYNIFSKNVIQFGHFIFNETIYDFFSKMDDLNKKAKIPAPFEVTLFRKKYFFRHLNPSPLCYLQNIHMIMPYLKNEREPNLENIFYKHMFHAILHGLDKKNIDELSPPQSFIYNGTHVLDEVIVVFTEYLGNGTSDSKGKISKEKMDAELNLTGVPEDHPVRKELNKLLNQEVEIDI